MLIFSAELPTASLLPVVHEAVAPAVPAANAVSSGLTVSTPGTAQASRRIGPAGPTLTAGNFNLVSLY
jgi:hypothetical protein